VKWYGPDREFLFLDTFHETLWADDGPFPSGGTVLNGEVFNSVGRHDNTDRDFCADMQALIG
jgi:hypothetical protein